MADLNVKLGPLSLKNPVMTASGTFGYGEEYEDFFPVEKLGAVVVKGIAPWPSHGNPTPRVAEVTGGMLNAIGLQGPGARSRRITRTSPNASKLKKTSSPRLRSMCRAPT